ncbi:YugN family protein [Salinithrix halophila]|uniref:YugN family protein n=1 Tax=Salinithrix halophila TaxID=1485204 RepID=A0ABV8JEV2_9BACL
MVLTDAGIKGKTGSYGEMRKTMEKVGFVRGGSWDYNKVNFDMKFSDENSDYYLRIQAFVTQGVLENPKAKVELDNPVFLRHIFPHGLNGDIEIPEQFQERIDNVLAELKNNLS